MKVFPKALGVSILLFILTGCAHPVNTSPTLSPSTTPTSPATSRTSATCLASQLVIQRGLEGAAMGSVGVTGMGFKNISTTPCTLKGFPKLQMLDATGHRISTHVLHGTSYTVQAVPGSSVMLTPGQVAKFDLMYHSATGYGRKICPTSTHVRITPPNLKKGITLNWQIQPYGGVSIQKLRCGEITVSPVYKN